MVDGPDTCHACDELMVCEICEACPKHCETEGGPDECWAKVEKSRRMLAPDRPSPPKPRWRS
jgi:hypothetical protein